MGFKDSREFRLGMAGEAVVQKWLLARGFGVIPVGLIDNGGAPSFETIQGKLILPDLQTFKGGVPRWVEVKTKDKSVLYRMLNRDRTGCNLRHWEAYLSIQAETQIEVWIAFLHLLNRDLWMQKVDVLRHSVMTTPGHDAFGGAPMAFWDRERFEVYPVSEREVGPCEQFRAKPSGGWTTTPPKEPPPDPQMQMFG